MKNKNEGKKKQEYPQSKVEYLKTPMGAYDEYVKLLYLLQS